MALPWAGMAPGRWPWKDDPGTNWFDQRPQGALASRQRVPDNDDPGTNSFDQRPPWQTPEIPLGDGRIGRESL